MSREARPTVYLPEKKEDHCVWSLYGKVSVKLLSGSKLNVTYLLRAHALFTISLGCQAGVRGGFVGAFKLVAYYLSCSVDPFLIPLGRLEVVGLVAWMKD